MKDRMKKLISLVLAMVLIVTVIPMGALAAEGAAEGEGWKNPFTDVKKADWFYDAVKYNNHYGYVAGTSENKFSPNMPTTREMFVTIFGRMVGVDENQYKNTNTFADVKPGWAEPYISWAAQNEVVHGTGNNKFSPKVPVSRQQAATIIYNYLKSQGKDLTVDDSAFYQFPDTGKIADYALDAMKWCVGKGVINGANGKLNPNGTATRAQVCQILWKIDNYMDESNGKEPKELPADYVPPVTGTDPDENNGDDPAGNPNAYKTLANGKPVTTKNIQEAILALHDKYPDGPSDWLCDPFVDELQTEIGLYRRTGVNDPDESYDFASMPSNAIEKVIPKSDSWYEDVLKELRVGDALFYGYNKGGRKGGHAVLVLDIYEDRMVCVEANYSRNIYWGRVITKNNVSSLLDSFESTITSARIYSQYPDDWDPSQDETSEEVREQIRQLLGYQRYEQIIGKR